MIVISNDGFIYKRNQDKLSSFLIALGLPVPSCLHFYLYSEHTCAYKHHVICNQRNCTLKPELINSDWYSIAGVTRPTEISPSDLAAFSLGSHVTLEAVCWTDIVLGSRKPD